MMISRNTRISVIFGVLSAFVLIGAIVFLPKESVPVPEKYMAEQREDQVGKFANNLLYLLKAKNSAKFEELEGRCINLDDLENLVEEKIRTEPGFPHGVKNSRNSIIMEIPLVLRRQECPG